MEADLEEKKQDKEHRRRKNYRERHAMESYERQGWTIRTRGFPTFVAQDRISQRPLRAVFVPRKNGLTKAQTLMKGILESKGIDCRVEGGLEP
jgi:hypothetical protein